MADPADERADVLAVEPETGERTEEPRHDHLGIADDAEGDGLRQRHGTAHREHVIAHAHLRRIAEADRRELARPVRLELDDGNVRERVCAHQFGLDLLAVPQRAEHPRRVPGHVMVRDQIAVLRDDRAAADLLHLHFASLGEFRRHHANADQRGPDPGDGCVHLRPQTR